MRRPAPRPLRAALAETVAATAPASLLARVQAAWPAVAGAVLAEEAAPVSERSGTVTFACRSAVWSAELELLAPDLLARLRTALEGSPPGPLEGLRFRVGPTP